MSVVNESEGEISYESDGSETDSTRTGEYLHTDFTDKESAFTMIS